MNSQSDKRWQWLLVVTGLSIFALFGIGAVQKADQKRAPKKAKAARQEPPPALATLAHKWSLTDDNLQLDFPALCLATDGTPWIAYIEHDSKADILRLARLTERGLEIVSGVSEPGVIHQPAVACDGAGGIWTFWGQVNERNIVSLRARRFANGKLDPAQILAESAGSDTFADAGMDHAGRVWVAWQSLRRGQGDIFARHFDPKSRQWSREFAVSTPQGGNWEPRLAFDRRDGAWVVFDSSRGGEFNLYLARVGLDGRTTEQRLTDSPEYEARASIAASGDGSGLWIAAERGRLRWGMELRGHDPNDGLNARKRILFGYYDIKAGKFTELGLPEDGKPAPRVAQAVNLPTLGIDAAGNPWMAYRFYTQNRWHMAVMQYDVKAKTWTRPAELPDSSLGQDRHATFVRDGGGKMLLCWPSDRRENKFCGTAGVFLAELEPLFPVYNETALTIAKLEEPAPYVNAPSADRPRTEHHQWSVAGRKFGLYWGDLHRHTDFSNCRTGQDGCINEHFRYAYDMAALDFMGTSDHTDVGKPYHPYEWWQTQRMVDVFYAPGRFTSLYAYEREQPYPWGHRNVVFAQRGGPLVYINRQLYLNSPWQSLYPAKPGATPLTPMELWDILAQYRQPVALISHTGATGMGTDWDKYDRIDYAFENTVEIFQGARVSYEALGAPQPTVGLLEGEPYTPSAKAGKDFFKPPAPIEDFGEKFNHGVYQRALLKGHKLGVFASSDHISSHTSFGGVYAENFTRQGLIDAFKARRTIAATDKIFVEFSCNGQPLGSIFETKDKPALKFAVNGTAPVKRLTIVRNEENYQVFEPAAREFQSTFTDPSPVAGENRYYLRIEQTDGNMAWSSPVWVTVKK
ncbi:MAG: hypothetical protein AB1705_26190 [Verrucomicrobiota bacterium]